MATIRDVAVAAGLNVGTVSRVINNRGYISAATREKVKHIMLELNYQPNEIARSLSKQRTFTIALIVPHISHPYFAKLIEHMEEASWAIGCKLLLCNSHADKTREKSYLELCKGNRVDGIVLCSVDIDSARFTSINIPVIVLERTGTEGTLCVVCDNRFGGELAAKKLLSSGCKNLLCIGGLTSVDMPADERTLGFEAECIKAGVNYSVVLTAPEAYHQLEYHDLLKKELLGNPDIDAIFTSNDIIASQAIQVCYKLGIDVPGKIQIIGFDDVLPASLTIPTITSIHQPIGEMAKAAISLIESKINGEDTPNIIKIPVTLTERESTL